VVGVDVFGGSEKRPNSCTLDAGNDGQAVLIDGKIQGTTRM
jgi:hypothetical protein